MSDSPASYARRRAGAGPPTALDTSVPPSPRSGTRVEAPPRRAPRDLDTFPKRLLDLAARQGERDAIREKDYGIWQTWTWGEVCAEVRALACGLASRGLGRGDKLAIIGDNRPRLYWSMCAAQMLGAIPVPMYQDSVAAELCFVLEHSEARAAVVEDQEQVDKLLEIKERCPHLRYVFYDNPRGLRHYDQPFLCPFDGLQEEGRRHQREHPGFLDAEIARGRGEDPAIILYTSGTTGHPKGVVLTHDNLLISARSAAEMEHLHRDEEVLAYLPMAWVGDNIFSYAQSYVTGFCVSCPESSATVLTDLREIGPTYFFAPPRIYESLLTTVLVRMEDASWIKRQAFDFFMRHARRVGSRILDGRPVPWSARLLYALGGVLVYGPLKNALGFSRIRLAYTAGEAIGPDIFDFYRSLGINIKQLYGQTEASVFITIQPDGQVKPDSVGTPAPGVEVRIGEDGEVLYRGPGVFDSYFKDPEGTARVRSGDGWVRSGDAGFLDEDGHLHVIDRAKDVGQLADGSLFAPKYLENKLKFFPSVSEAVVFGDGREYVAAFVCIDLEAVGSWAERHNLPYSGYQDLASRKEVYDLVAECIEQVNRDLAAEPHLASSQIRRFLLLYKHLDADDGELTRTRKVRRSFIREHYRVLIDALYSDATRCEFVTEVTFEDGRRGSVRADVPIRDVRVYEPLAKAS